MTIRELLSKLRRVPSDLQDLDVLIYNDGDFVIEDAWLDKGRAHEDGLVFAIQVVPSQELLMKKGDKVS